MFFEKVLQNTSYIKKILFEFLIAFSFVVSGIILVDFKNDSSYLNYIGNSKDILESKKATESNLRIYEPIVILEKLVKIKCEILNVTKGSLKKNLKGKILIYLTKDNSSTYQLTLASSFGDSTAAQTGQEGPLIRVDGSALSSATPTRISIAAKIAC